MSDEPNFTPQELRDLGLPTYADLRKIADEFHWLANQRGDLLAKREDELDEARAKIAELEAPVEPVPAPRLEWQFYPDNGHFYDPRKPWNIHIGRGDGTFADGTIGGNGDAHEARLTGSITVVCANVAAAKELAEKLEAVLSPPVGGDE